MDYYTRLTDSDKELFDYVDKVFPRWQTYSIVARLNGKIIIEFSKTEYPENLTSEEYLDTTKKKSKSVQKTFLVTYQI